MITNSNAQPKKIIFKKIIKFHKNKSIRFHCIIRDKVNVKKIVLNIVV